MSIQFSNLFAFAALVLASLSLNAQVEPVATITERLNPQTKEWQNIQQLTFVYDEEGNATEQVSAIWNNADADWKVNTKTINEFDQDGTLIAADCLTYNEKQGNWTKAQRIEPNYTKGVKTGNTMYIWDSINDDWIELMAAQQNRINQNTAKTNTFDHTQAITNSYDAQGRVIEATVTSTTNGNTRVMRTKYAYKNASDIAATDVNLGNYPNPVNTWTSIQFELAEEAYVRIDLFDAQGRMVSNISDDSFTAGAQEVTFDASNLPAGMYFYNLVVNGAQVAGNNMFVGR